MLQICNRGARSAPESSEECNFTLLSFYKSFSGEVIGFTNRERPRHVARSDLTS
jgi:hypothetical protein